MLACSLLLAAAASVGGATYSVQTGEENIGGFVSGGSQLAYVIYPTGTPPGQKFPLISFAHGNRAGGKPLLNVYEGMLSAWAAAGYIVVATEACTGANCKYTKTESFAADQIHVIDVVKNNATHPIWRLVDPSRIAIAGHSMGGVATVYNAAKFGASAPFQAAAPLHPCPNEERAPLASIHTPIFYGTGSADTLCSIAGVKNQFTGSNPPKLFVELTGAQHTEPEKKTGCGWNDNVVKFFNCELSKVQADCEYTYGTAQGDLCQGGSKTTACFAQQQ